MKLSQKRARPERRIEATSSLIIKRPSLIDVWLVGASLTICKLKKHVMQGRKSGHKNERAQEASVDCAITAMKTATTTTTNNSEPNSNKLLLSTFVHFASAKCTTEAYSARQLAAGRKQLSAQL